jgi:hypothetical protein
MSKRIKRTVEFTKDFSTKKKGDEWSCDGMLASSLIKRKVAVYVGESVKDTTEDENKEENKEEKKSSFSQKMQEAKQAVKDAAKKVTENN